MAERSRLSTALTDVIVRRGDRDVIRCAAGNEGAAFSDASFTTLVRRAGQDGVLTLRIGRRDDLPPEHLKSLLAGSIDVIRRRLQVVAKPERQAEIKLAMSEIEGVVAQVEGRDAAVCEPDGEQVRALRRVAARERDAGGQLRHGRGARHALCARVPQAHHAVLVRRGEQAVYLLVRPTR